ncbi:hypothetical protein [Anaeromicrobium sediminis]|uniref:Uncharacterized protein n=1 Tax=Anaeromicrobium sediminis TaxID=1478221 RepID=A0A267MG28_9FIRM|nr:hypothetical protein [Anaeromicrobium sediminis]PAB57743.1 hypothetical protein CCE28_18140 [Anaeromicrobium sediminis]
MSDNMKNTDFCNCSTIKVINNLPVELKYQTEYLIDGQFEKCPISSIPPGHKGIIFKVNDHSNMGLKGGVIYYYDDSDQHRKYVLFEFIHSTNDHTNKFFLSAAPANTIKWSQTPDNSGNIVYTLHDFKNE